MDDQFDEDLTKRIREVFDDYKDTSADKGWTRLRKKFPERTNRRAIAWMWWGSAAALILLFLGIFWLNQSLDTPKKQFAAAKNTPSVKQPVQTPAPGQNQGTAGRATVQPPDHALAASAGHTVASTPGASRLPAHNAISNQNRGLLATGTRGNPASNVASSAVGQNNNSQAANTSGNATTLASAVKTAHTPAANPSSTAKPDSTNTQIPNDHVTAAVPGINMREAGKANKQQLADNGLDRPQKGLSENNLVRFGVYAATYFNYARGSNSQFNVGGGLSADIKLSRKLKVSTGIAITQNSLSYPGQASFYTPAGINLAPLSVFSASTLQYSVSEPSFRNYNADLVGVDIPLNLKYTFDPGKSETYLLAGVSSGTFLDETYTYSFTNSTSQSQSTRNSFSGFYFARMLNFAIGTGYRIGANRLIIEPFLKYPLEGLGSQQIRFGSGGVNLKFSIPSQKR